MTESFRDTSERLIPGRESSARQYLLYLRHRFMYEYARERLPAAPRVVDVGCGAGYGAPILSSGVRELVGLDVDEEGLRYARTHFAAPRCSFRSYDGVRIPYEDGRFDAALCFQVIEHVRDDRRFAAELARVLAPQGQLFLTTPNGRLRVPPGKKPWNRHHLREYDAEGLERLLGSAFGHVEIHGIRGRDEAQRLEEQRIADIRRIVALDPLRLRDRIPEPLRQLGIRVLEGLRGSGDRERPGADWRERFDVSDFYVSDERIEASIDLVAICRR